MCPDYRHHMYEIQISDVDRAQNMIEVSETWPGWAIVVFIMILW